MPPPLKLTLINSLEGLPAHIEAIGTYLHSKGVSQYDTHCAEIVVEELITNTIKYGYRDSQAHEIDIELTITPKIIHLQIIDDATPFDPTSIPLRPLSPQTPMEECKPGGLGLLLVKKLTKAFCYERKGLTNKQTLTLSRT